MRTVNRIFSRAANLLWRGRAEREMSREMEAHLGLLRDEFARRGMSPAEARSAALKSFGGVEQVREMHREARSVVWIEQSLQDLRYAVRGLLRSPGFTVVAVVTLALGIGVNTALFTAWNAVALKPLPVRDPGHVLRFERWFESGSLGNIQYAFSLPEYNYCRKNGNAFANLVAASWVVGVSGTGVDGSNRRSNLDGQLVSSNYFDDLGIQLKVGRGFAANDAGEPVVVISSRFWRRALDSDPRATGRTLTLNGAVFTIIGITPEKFTGTSINPHVPDFWAPLSMQRKIQPGQDWLREPAQRALQIFARVKPSTPVAGAQAEASLLIRQYAATYSETGKTTAVTLQRTSYFPNTEDIRFKALIAGAMLIVGLVLFVACVNVGNMLLARGAARQREISTRLALGAGRARIVRQLLTESIVLSCLGGAAGLAASFWTTRMLAVSLAGSAIAMVGDIAAVDLNPDARVVLYVLAVSVCSGILFGLSPALRLMRRDVASALKEDGGFIGKLRGAKLRGFLVGAQVTVSIILLATAGLLARGMLRSRGADPGFDTRGIFVPAGHFGGFDHNPAMVVEHQKALLEKLRSLPEVAGVTLGSVPFAGTWTPPIIVNGAGARTLASCACETWFDVMGIPLVQGRNFARQEVSTDAPVALISQSTARRFWPAANPVGKRFALDLNFNGKFKTFEVIGIVGDVRFANLTRIDPAHVYVPGAGHNSNVLLRLRGERRQAIAAVTNMMQTLEPAVLQDARLVSLDEGFVAILRALSRGLAAFAAILAGLAMTLAGIGIYGVVAYLFGQRTKEIGIRMALGADRGLLLRNVVLQALRPVFVGMACGFALAAALSALLHRTLIFPGSMDFFYGVPFYDPATFTALFCFVALLAIVASLAPVRRALRVDPMIALRYE